MEFVSIPKIQEIADNWNKKKAFWLQKQGTSFGNLNEELYAKVLEAKKVQNLTK